MKLVVDFRNFAKAPENAKIRINGTKEKLCKAFECT
jgi:hypothetical protein